MKVGILALQGAVAEHVHMVERAGAVAIPIKKADQLDDADGLIIPGGESTTIGRLMRTFGFIDPIRRFSERMKPIFGTCAGAILLAKQISGQDEAHLQLMDIKVTRNAFGRQRESFEADLKVDGLDEPFRAVFIRAPLIDEAGDGVHVLARHNGRIAAARQGHLLAATFHPELTEDLRMHEYFLKMIENRGN